MILFALDSGCLWDSGNAALTAWEGDMAIFIWAKGNKLELREKVCSVEAEKSCSEDVERRRGSEKRVGNFFR